MEDSDGTYVRLIEDKSSRLRLTRLQMDDATRARIKLAARTILDSGVLDFECLPSELYTEAYDIIDREMDDSWNGVRSPLSALTGSVKDVLETMSRL